MENRIVDICIIGAGLSGTMTLTSILASLADNEIANETPVNIYVIEQDDQFFCGPAYGNRSGRNALTINSIQDFLPDSERDKFLDWAKNILKAHVSNQRKSNFDSCDNGREKYSTECFYEDVKSLIDYEREHGLKDCYFPRYLFGEYLRFSVENSVKNAEEQCNAKVTYYKSKVTDIQNKNDAYCIECASESADSIYIESNVIVVAVGGLPTRNLAKHTDEYGPVVDNIYTHNIDAEITKLEDRLVHAQEKSGVAIIGSNASAAELLYLMQKSQACREQIDFITVASPTGCLPYFGKEQHDDFIPENTIQLLGSENITTKMIVDKVKIDTQVGKELGFSIEQIASGTFGVLDKLLPRLSLEEKNEFLAYGGDEIGKIQRRISHIYSSSVNYWDSRKKLRLVTGKYISVSKKGFYRFSYIDKEGLYQISDPVIAIFNCTGQKSFGELDDSNLVSNGLKSGLFSQSRSRTGISVNDRLEASKDIFVVGPQLSGNIIGGKMLWHAEHCGRLIAWSKFAGVEIVKSLQKLKANEAPKNCV